MVQVRLQKYMNVNSSGNKKQKQVKISKTFLK